MNARDRMILALDVDRLEEAQEIVRQFGAHVGMFKVGKQLFTHCGTTIIDYIKSMNARIFLDLKYHDIPNTVAKAAVEATKLGVTMFNVHASGGFTMMREARSAIEEASGRLGIPRPMMIAVTVLTSIDDAELARMGISVPAAELTRRLALLTKEAGLDGVVASGQDAAMIRQLCGPDFLIVTPGVRISDTKDDQKRTIGPREAITSGASHIVLGRTVLGTKDPKETLQQVERQIRDALSDQS